MHSHPNHVIYSLTSAETKFTSADGKTQTVKGKAGQAIWHNAETHVIDIELKK